MNNFSNATPKVSFINGAAFYLALRVNATGVAGFRAHTLMIAEMAFEIGCSGVFGTYKRV